MRSAYFRQLVRSNGKFLVAFTLVLCIFLIVMTNVFTPQTLGDVSGAIQGTIAANIISGSSLVGFMSNSFYALMAIVFPMVYSIVVGNRMIAEKVDKGSMACFLATPVGRLTITLSSAGYFVLSLAVMWGVATLVGIVAANAFQPGELDVETFLLLNLGVFLYHLAISGICFCASCVFNSSKYSLLVGGGVPLYFFVISLFIKLSDDLDFLRYVTLNTLFDTLNILAGSGYAPQFVALAVIALVLYSVGIICFQKKDLPL